MLLAAVLLTPLLWIPWIRHPWSPHSEWRLLQESLPTLPEGATLLFADRGSHAEKVQEVMRALAPELHIEPIGPWLDRAAPPKDTFAWLGVLCHLQSLPGRDMDHQPDPCARLSQQCRLTPWDVEEIAGGGDTDLFPDAPFFSIGLYRIDGCQPPASGLSNQQPGR